MTCLEATACSTTFVASRVGEVMNVIGKEYTVPFDNEFEQNFAIKCIDVLSGKLKEKVALKECYKAEYISKTEIAVFKKVLGDFSDRST